MQSLSFYLGVLVLAGIELTFFIAAPVVLCLGFVTKIVLTTHILVVAEQCSHSLFWFSPCSTSEQAGDTQEVGREHTGTGDAS